LVLVAAPMLQRHRANRNVQGFVKGAYAAAIGTILGASVLLGGISIGDWLTILIGLVSLLVLFRWMVSNLLLMAAAAVVGLIAFPLLGPAWVMVPQCVDIFCSWELVVIAVGSSLTNEWVSVALLAVRLLAGYAGAAPNAAAPPLQLQSIADIPLGGHPTLLDFASLDAGRHLLFIAHLGDSEVIVFAKDRHDRATDSDARCQGESWSVDCHRGVRARAPTAP